MKHNIKRKEMCDNYHTKINMKYIKKNRKELFFFSLIFFIELVVYYIGIENNSQCYNSDYAYYAIAGKDILNGNVFLKGWYGSTNTFYFTALIYGLFGKIIGYSVQLIYIVSAFVWAAFSLTLSLMVYFLNAEKSNTERYIRIFLVVILLSMSCYFSQANRIYAGYHVDVAILGYIYLWISTKSIDEKKIEIKSMIVALICLMFGVFSDGLMIYFVAIPLVLVYGYYLIIKKHKDEKKIILINLFLTIGTTLLAKAIFKIVELYGGIQLTYSTTSVGVVNSSELFERLEYCVEELIYVLGFDIFGKKMGLDMLLVGIKLIIWMGIFYTLYKSFYSLKKKKFNQVIATSAVLEILVLLFTTYIDTQTSDIQYTSRIMYYFFIPVVLIAGQADNIFDKLCITKKNKALILVLLGVICVLNLYELNSGREKQEKNRIEKVVEVLNEKGLKKGYGTWEVANITTLASNCKISVNPACNNANDFSKYKWLSTNTDDWEYANFVLIDDSKWEGIDEQFIIDAIGEPKEKLMIDNISLFIWNKNIIPYIDGAGKEEDFDYWWDKGEEQFTENEVVVSNRHFKSSFEANGDGKFVSTGKGQLIYGPYEHIGKGKYDFEFDYDYVGNSDENILGYVDVYSNQGNIKSDEKEILKNNNTVVIRNIYISNSCTDFELRAYANLEGLSINCVKIKKIDN